MDKYKVIQYLIITLNIFLALAIIYFIKITDSDKSPLILIIFYPILAILNCILLIVFWFLKNKYVVKLFKINLLILMLLIFPICYFIITF